MKFLCTRFTTLLDVSVARVVGSFVRSVINFIGSNITRIPKKKKYFFTLHKENCIFYGRNLEHYAAGQLVYSMGMYEWKIYQKGHVE